MPMDSGAPGGLFMVGSEATTAYAPVRTSMLQRVPLDESDPRRVLPPSQTARPLMRSACGMGPASKRREGGVVVTSTVYTPHVPGMVPLAFCCPALMAKRFGEYSAMPDSEVMGEGKVRSAE